MTRRARWWSDVLDVIDRCVLFTGLTDQAKRMIGEIATRHSYPDGTTLVYAGDPGRTLFLIERGAVDVLVPGEAGEVVVATLRAEPTPTEQYSGGFFGEMSLLDVEPRSASVRAKGNVTLVALPQKKLGEVFDRRPEIHLVVMTNIARVLSRRLREANARWDT